jgi:hypothetical protein
MKPIERRSRAPWVVLLLVLLGCLPAGEAFDRRVTIEAPVASAPPVLAVADPSSPVEVAAPPETSRQDPPQTATDNAAERPRQGIGNDNAAAGPGQRNDDAAVVVVLDGTRWQEVFVGADPALASAARVEAPSAPALMPNLHALLEERGAALGAPEHGPPMTASGPNFVSLPGYTEIFRGRRRHPCADNDCPRTRERTVFDEMQDGGELGDVAVFSSWDRIQRAATADDTKLVLSSGRSRMANEAILRDDGVASAWLDEGRAAAPFPGKADFRPDRFTAALALRYLEVRRPRLLFIGLGEPDEYAHRGSYGGYLDSLRAADRIIGQLFEVLDRLGPRGEHTTVFVTADHGRARDYRFHGGRFPESARVWLVAAGGKVSARGLVGSSRQHHLADLAPTLRVLLGLPPDTAPAAGTPMDELFTRQDG